MFSKILIANRGEIALRVIRACRTLGIRTVAVFSEADRTAPHVRYADEAYAIGPAEPSASYLNIERILGAARTAKADAIHPGYGFLSENAAFAEACVRAGIVFVGPPPSVLRSVGDKDEARRTMAAAGVPVIPGSDRALADADEARRIAATLGYPVALKAASGGGGRGIRRVADAGALAEAFGRAAREAQQAFGDGRLYLEKLVESARHVEVQVLGDAHGNLRALGERACSVQRRNQKLLEETPAPGLTEALRATLLRTAETCMRKVGYVGAGTVEFLLDREDRFYFMEVNARIQVEHPITEMTTGIDIVQWQIRVAAGERLDAGVLEARSRGHAIEARICAEDPARDFSPSGGRIEALSLPGGPLVRVDGALCALDAIPLHYDSLLAKVCAHGRDRTEAIRRLDAALRELRVEGVATTGPFLRSVLAHPLFVAGTYDTGIVSSMRHAPTAGADEAEAAAVCAAILEHRRRRGRGAASPDAGRRTPDAPWRDVARAEALRDAPVRGAWRAGDHP